MPNPHCFPWMQFLLNCIFYCKATCFVNLYPQSTRKKKKKKNLKKKKKNNPKNEKGCLFLLHHFHLLLFLFLSFSFSHKHKKGKENQQRGMGYQSSFFELHSSFASLKKNQILFGAPSSTNQKNNIFIAYSSITNQEKKTLVFQFKSFFFFSSQLKKRNNTNNKRLIAKGKGVIFLLF